MIKVITLTQDAWDIGIYATKEQNMPKENRKYAFESSILNTIIEDGWNIKDWNMMQSNEVSRIWTFILEKKNK